MLISIITFHRAYNVGAVLQSYALSEFLKSLGHIVVFPDTNEIGADKTHFQKVAVKLSPVTEAIKSIVWFLGSGILAFGFEDLRRLRFRNFVNKHLHITSQHGSSLCECSVYGSDQIWNNKLTGKYSNLFLGNNFPTSKHKIAYAASIGDNATTQEHQDAICSAAQNFDAISTREPLPFSLQDKFGRSSSVVIDPTLLIPRTKYDEIAHPQKLTHKKYIFVYLALSCPEALPLARHIAKELQLNVICVDVLQRGLWRKPREVTLTCSPDRFLAYIRDAEFVITNSFHGTALSAIYGKRFVSISGGQNEEIPFRVSTLLNRLRLENRIASHCPSEYNNTLIKLQAPLPCDLADTTEEIAKQSREWLRNALAEIQHA